MSYQTSSKRLPPFWLLIGARKLLCFSAQSEGRMAVTVWNWSGKTLSPGALLAVLYFSLCHIFLPFRLSLTPTICPWVSEDGCENDWGLILSPPAFRKRPEKIRKFSAQWIVLKQSTNFSKQSLQNVENCGQIIKVSTGIFAWSTSTTKYIMIKTELLTVTTWWSAMKCCNKSKYYKLITA